MNLHNLVCLIQKRFELKEKKSRRHHFGPVFEGLRCTDSSDQTCNQSLPSHHALFTRQNQKNDDAHATLCTAPSLFFNLSCFYLAIPLLDGVLVPYQSAMQQ